MMHPTSKLADPAGMKASGLRPAAASRTGRRRRSAGPPWYYVLPAAAFFLFVVLLPSVRGVYLGFTDWKGGREPEFVGLKNFERLFNDPLAVGAVLHTLGLAAMITVIQVLMGLIIALVLNTHIKSRNVLRVFFFAPAVVLPIAVAFLWQYLFAPNGPMNEILGAVGLESWQQNWLGDPSIALWAIGITVIWQYSGYSMVIFLANLQSIDDAMIEASHLDGASAWQRFWYVIRPELGPAMVINVLLTITSSLKLFDQVWAMTTGGPGGATETLSTLMYRVAYQYSEFGYGSAIAIVLALIVVVISIAQFRIFTRGGAK